MIYTLGTLIARPIINDLGDFCLGTLSAYLLGMTHEQYIQAVRTLVLEQGLEVDHHNRIESCKLTYGLGTSRVRGTACACSWSLNNQQVGFINISAKAEESLIQLVGTTIHELGHIASAAKGHGKKWKAVCNLLGLTTVEAKGQKYEASHFNQYLWALIDQLDKPTDGSPNFGTNGTSKAKGSRLRLWECSCVPVVKVRVASDSFTATCNLCNQPFNSV